MPVDPQALAWAKQNPNRPEAQQLLAKDWAMNNPDRPEAKQLLSKYGASAPKSSDIIQTGHEASGPMGDRQLMMNLGANPKNQEAVVNSLPYVGGALGTMVGPEGTGIGAAAGTVAAAGLGAGFGSAAKNVVSADEASPGDALRQVGSDAFYKGALPEAGGQVLGAAVKYGSGALAKFLKPAAERADVMDKVKDVAELGPYVSDKISEAEDAYDAAKITPAMADQYKGASGQFIEVDPKTIQGIHPDIDKIMEQYPVNTQTGKASMPMEDALDLRSELNSRTRFKQGGVYSTADAVRNAQSQAADAGNMIRSEISKVDPGITGSSEELRQSYNLKNAAIGGADKRPISSVVASPATDKASVLAQFDNAAGSDLSRLGKNIKTAQDRLSTYTPKNLKKLLSLGAPREAFDMLATPAARAYDATAQTAVPYLEKASQGSGASPVTALGRMLLRQNGGNGSQ